MFPYFAHLKAESSGSAAAQGAFRVVCDTYVSKGDGTEIVHNAPFFGEDDLRVCLANGEGSSFWCFVQRIAAK